MKQIPGLGIVALAMVVAGSVAALTAPSVAWAQGATTKASPSAAALASVPPISEQLSHPRSEMREVVERWTADQAALLRRYDAPYSPYRRDRMREFHAAWRARLAETDFDALSREAQIDYLLLDNRLRYELELLDREEKLMAEMAPLLPFAGRIFDAHEAWRRHEPVDGAAAAAMLDRLAAEVGEARAAVEAGLRGEKGGVKTSRIVAYRAAEALASLGRTLASWYGFYAGYDPVFTWWAAEPYRAASEALSGYAAYLRQAVVGIAPGGEEPIVGDPIGPDGMEADLAVEMIAYTPAELIEIAEREFAWLEGEMKKAAREMGYGDDWKAALEKVKTLHAPPGGQPQIVRMLAEEAEAFLDAGGYVTIPPLAREVWRMQMMSPERQKIAPFFLSGEVIQIAFPTDEMEHGDKLMSLRGNNLHFSRATVHHELIPGHHLQGFMNARHFPHRRAAFRTPFWTEGGALYWEFFLWDNGFPQSPEDRVGMLFWRMHRAARIIFSLGFHLGEMTPQEAIDFLVDRVGHERANAEAEVRRSFNGTYSPLYQAAYMVGGLQIRALYNELVGSGKMSAREFHDALYEGGTMPIAMVRARLTGQPLSREGLPPWRFAESLYGENLKASGKRRR